MKKNFKRLIRPAVFTLSGIAAGVIIYFLFGCKSGCAISSNPVLTAVWFGVIGLLLSFITAKEKTKDSSGEE